MGNTGVDFDDREYTWPPGALDHEQPAPGPDIARMRLDSIEARLANLESGSGDVLRRLTDIDEAITIAIDALTYLAGSVERLRASQAPSDTQRRLAQ
jgi:hypothetical protein